VAARARRGRRRRRAGAWGWLLVVAAVVVAGGAGAFLWQQRRAAEPAAIAAGDPPPKARAKPAPATPAAPAEDPERFEFYDLLPDQEVEVDAGRPRPPGAQPPPLRAPGIFVIQAGSFPGHAEADAVRARLALLGIESTLQTITVDGRTFHRVRIGPIEDPVRLNNIRTRLRANKVEHLVVQVTE
jgi:cell division protein FtsN